MVIFLMTVGSDSPGCPITQLLLNSKRHDPSLAYHPVLYQEFYQVSCKMKSIFDRLNMSMNHFVCIHCVCIKSCCVFPIELLAQDEYTVDVELNFTDVKTEDYLRSLLNNGSFSVALGPTVNVTNIDITTGKNGASSGLNIIMLILPIMAKVLRCSQVCCVVFPLVDQNRLDFYWK